MKYAVSTILVLIVLLLVNFPMLGKAVDYSFNVAAHGEYDIAGRCFGIDDAPGERLLITDCGGYLNALTSFITLGLSRSSIETQGIYTGATERYLASSNEACVIDEVRDLGGRLFEIYYHCEEPSGGGN